jgi:hypothetical protein
MPVERRRLELKTLLLEADKVVPFLRSVAYAIVLQRNVRIRWRETDSLFLRGLYGAFFGLKGRPGVADVTTGTTAEIEEQTKVETAHLIDSLFSRIQIGSVAAARYLTDMEDLRGFNLEAVQETFAEGSRINAEITGELATGIQRLALYKAGGTIVVKVLGQVPGPGWLLALGYDVVVGTVDDLEKPGTSNAVGVAFGNLGASVRDEIRDKAAEHVTEAIEKRLNGRPTVDELEHFCTKMRQLEEKIAGQVERRALRLAQQGTPFEGPGAAGSIQSLTTQIARNEKALGAAQKGVLRAGAKAVVAKAVSWGFLGHDIYKTLEEYRETLSATR